MVSHIKRQKKLIPKLSSSDTKLKSRYKNVISVPNQKLVPNYRVGTKLLYFGTKLLYFGTKLLYFGTTLT